VEAKMTVMKRKMALIMSGVVTAVVMVVVIGLLQLSGNFSNVAQAAPVKAAASQATINNSTDVATLQAEVAAYRAQLQQAYADLQQAYNQIQALSGANGNGSRGLRGRGEGAGG
jgi:hypothetical protein